MPAVTEPGKGSFVLFQPPNTAFKVVALAAVARRLTHGPAQRHAESAFDAALAVWAGDEVLRGVNWYRRLLGAVTLGYVAHRRRVTRTADRER